MRPSRMEELKEAPNLVALPEKNNGLLSRFMRVGLIFFLIASISLALCSAFSSQTTSWFPILAQNQTRTANPTFTDNNTELPTNISHILFGLGSSVGTWRDRSRWPKHGGTGTRHEFKYTHSQSEVRIGRIVVDSFNLRLPDVRWFVMGDDDTVFFPDNLASVLSRYDHNKMYYIGGNSESVEQDVMHAYDMAFGGGGFAISYALAARLAELMDGCLDRYYNMYGSDQRVGLRERDRCAANEAEWVPPAAHPLAPLLSLHHIDAVEPIFPNQSHLDAVKALIHAYRVDPPRILQQSLCYDRRRKWTVSISWGYTLQLYPSMVSALELKTPLQTFKTWRSWTDGPFTFNTRPVSSNPCEKPITYFLEHVKDGRSGNTLTTYKRSRLGGDNAARLRIVQA
ncbi:hypothetical protein ACLB2K_071546 [Fragaria x ananassa]